jgi:hypothetical protein
MPRTNASLTQTLTRRGHLWMQPADDLELWFLVAITNLLRVPTEGRRGLHESVTEWLDGLNASELEPQREKTRRQVLDEWPAYQETDPERRAPGFEREGLVMYGASQDAQAAERWECLAYALWVLNMRTGRHPCDLGRERPPEVEFDPKADEDDGEIPDAGLAPRALCADRRETMAIILRLGGGKKAKLREWGYTDPNDKRPRRTREEMVPELEYMLEAFPQRNFHIKIGS